jgi:hypothetical protein
MTKQPQRIDMEEFGHKTSEYPEVMDEEKIKMRSVAVDGH